ncbi:hypothetical protein [Mucilaginibacter glaciei]|uniref:Outer membrane protein with beta-barrel domain n=1 Tax=Mucilaginibacter glaciei TaxID=2772109 RepID=A0A926NNY1_9SPHI|nr:hypothetical protein [Mucilaginibacter glaciei]MBD1391955.1 hypothetical protein [Mucilaginibacter glaciei]
MKKIFTILFVAGVIIGTTTVKAQSTKSSMEDRFFKKDISGAALLQVGYRQTDLSQLNGYLAQNGIPAISNNNYWINAAMQKVYKKWITEHGIGFTIPNSSEANGIKARYSQAALFLRFGYNLSKSSNFQMYPFAGVSANLAMFNIKDKTGIESTPNFAQEILNKTSSKTLYQTKLGVDLGLGFDYLFKVKSKEMEHITLDRSIPVGFRLGYHIGAAQSDFKVDDHKLSNGPTDKNSAFFATVSFGLGYHITKR